MALQISQCIDSTYTRCSNPNLPSSFCCDATAFCLSVAENSTAICCPEGLDCTLIQAITCDISQLNVLLTPESAIHTLNLNSTLPSCGSECCPFGYTCRSAGSCALDDADRHAAPVSTFNPSDIPAVTVTSGSQPVITVTATPSMYCSSRFIICLKGLTHKYYRYQPDKAQKCFWSTHCPSCDFSCGHHCSRFCVYCYIPHVEMEIEQEEPMQASRGSDGQGTTTFRRHSTGPRGASW